MLHSFMLTSNRKFTAKGKNTTLYFSNHVLISDTLEKKLIQEKKQKQPTMLLQVPTIKKHSSQHQIYGKTSHLLAQ